MFNVGELIIYGNTGVCKVMNVCTPGISGLDDDRLYYELKPCYQREGNNIMTPVENRKVPMRRILNKEEANQLIQDMPKIDMLWIESDKTRENQYKECIRSADCREWVRMIKTLYQRRMDRLRQGKRMTATDERYLRQAKDYLFSELSIPLGIPKDEMGDYIEKTIGPIEESLTEKAVNDTGAGNMET